MLVFYNLNIDAIACKNRQGQHSVHDVLELDPLEWNCDFGRASVIDIAVGGAASDYRRQQSERSSKVVSVAFVLVELNGLEWERPLFCCRGKRDLHGYSCSSVSLCSFRGTRTSLESSSDKPKVGLHTILHELDYPEDILRQLRKMTVTHRVEMLKHCRPYVKESVKTGKWRCHWEWNDAVAKIVQRMQDIGAFRGSDVPLNCCPCQLGTSDARDWEVIGDPCGQADVSLDSLVSTSCRCGRLSFKPFSATSTEMGYRIPEEHCKGVLLHMFKELLVQGLVGGQVQHMFNGRMARGEHDTAGGLWRSFEMSGDAAARNKDCNLRNHICFLIAKKHLYHLKNDLAEQHGELNAERLLSVLPFDKIVERGEFHIAGAWLDDFKQKLLLQRGVICREEMVLWVGNYVGDSVYSIEGIIQTLKKPATPAFMSVLPYHIKELVQQPDVSFLDSVCVDDVGHACAAANAHRLQNVLQLALHALVIRQVQNADAVAVCLE